MCKTEQSAARQRELEEGLLNVMLTGRLPNEVLAWGVYGEIIRKPFDIYHTQTDLAKLATIIRGLDEEVRVVMEATGIYHLPVLTFLKEEGFFVATANPLEMKRYRCQGIRNAKTDRIDSKIIANYGLDF